jgi:hypothetical protein
VSGSRRCAGMCMLGGGVGGIRRENVSGVG